MLYHNVGIRMFLVATFVVAIALLPLSTAARKLDSPDARATVPTKPVTPDEKLAAAAEEVPNLGGYGFDRKSNTLFVYLTSPTGSDAAVAALIGQGLLRSSRASTAREIRHADFTAKQLLDWRAKIRTDWDRFPGLVALSVTPQTNRVTMGLDSEEHIAPIKRQLETEGIPLEAVDLEVTGRAQFDQSLQSDFDPIVGGIQILNVDYLHYCTLGFVGTRSSVDGYVTASHCSENFGQGSSSTGQVSNGQDFDQTGIPDYIGSETINPAFGNYYGCPTNHSCKYSDALWVPADSGRDYTVGAIARTEDFDSLTIDSSNPEFTVNGWSNVLGVDDFVEKMGKSTGWTDGTVTDLCVDFTVGSITILCTVQTNFLASAGDSGAPVFTRDYFNTPDEATLVGIYSGHSGSNKYFTDMGWVLYDLGGTWSVN